MKYIGIDFGQKNIGVAVSVSGKLATELVTVHSVKELAELIEKEEPSRLVVGLPKSSLGGFGVSALTVKAQTDELIKLLSDAKLKIEFVDETLTSFEAEDQLRTQGVELKKIKDRVDQRAAKIILEQFLNSER